jgi:predicted dehydrogenase
MAVSLVQADRLLDAVRRFGRGLMVGYMKRYDAGNLLAKSYIQQLRAGGELGPITYVRSHGLCGDWTAGLYVPIETSDEPVPSITSTGPDWLPPEFFNQ